jgi:hypothetical protein
MAGEWIVVYSRKSCTWQYIQQSTIGNIPMKNAGKRSSISPEIEDKLRTAMQSWHKKRGHVGPQLAQLAQCWVTLITESQSDPALITQFITRSKKIITGTKEKVAPYKIQYIARACILYRSHGFSQRGDSYELIQSTLPADHYIDKTRKFHVAALEHALAIVYKFKDNPDSMNDKIWDVIEWIHEFTHLVKGDNSYSLIDHAFSLGSAMHILNINTNKTNAHKCQKFFEKRLSDILNKSDGKGARKVAISTTAKWFKISEPEVERRLERATYGMP